MACGGPGENGVLLVVLVVMVVVVLVLLLLLPGEETDAGRDPG